MSDTVFMLVYHLETRRPTAKDSQGLPRIAKTALVFKRQLRIPAENEAKNLMSLDLRDNAEILIELITHDLD